MYITFRHKFQHSFVAKAKTIHRYLYILVIQNQFLHFCTCTMWAQYNVLSTLHWPFLCATVFLERRRSRKTTKIRIFMEAFFLAKGSFNNYVEKTKYRQVFSRKNTGKQIQSNLVIRNVLIRNKLVLFKEPFTETNFQFTS